MPTRPPIHNPHPRPTVRPADTRPSAAARGYDHNWRKRRLAYLRENPLCVHCLAKGDTKPATQVDHVIALAKGGADEPGNWQALCASHHSIKTAREDRGNR